MLYPSLYIHSPVDTRLDCFHLLAILNYAVVKVGVQISLWDLSVFTLKNYMIDIYSLGLECYVFLFGLVFSSSKSVPA